MLGIYVKLTSCIVLFIKLYTGSVMEFLRRIINREICLSNLCEMLQAVDDDDDDSCAEVWYQSKVCCQCKGQTRFPRSWRSSTAMNLSGWFQLRIAQIAKTLGSPSIRYRSDFRVGSISNRHRSQGLCYLRRCIPSIPSIPRFYRDLSGRKHI